MQRQYQKIQACKLNMFAHKRVFSEINSVQSRHYFDINAPMVESIRQPTISGLQLLCDFIKMKQVLNIKKAFETIVCLHTPQNKVSLKKNITTNRSRGNLHKRGITLESQKDLQRANIITQIIQKLHSKESKKENFLRRQSPKLSYTSNKRRQRALTNKFNNISTNQSNQKSKLNTDRFNTKQSQASIEIGQSYLNHQTRNFNNDSMFKKLRHQITKVKQQVFQLQTLNQEYRRQNHILRLKSYEKQYYPYSNCCHKQIICQCNCFHSHKSLGKRRNLTYVESPRNNIMKCYNCGSNQIF